MASSQRTEQVGVYDTSYDRPIPTTKKTESISLHERYDQMVNLHYRRVFVKGGEVRQKDIDIEDQREYIASRREKNLEPQRSLMLLTSRERPKSDGRNLGIISTSHFGSNHPP